MRWLIWCAAAVAAGLPCAALASAEVRISVEGVGDGQFAVAAAPFRGDAVELASVVLADLERSGLFRAIGKPPSALDEATLPDLGPLRMAKADALIVGSVVRMPDGRSEVRFRLWDVVRAQDLGGKAYLTHDSDMRLAAHQIADDVYQKLTGDRGVSATRIAYVTKAAGKYNLWVAQADGGNARSALASPAPIISPTWSGDGSRLAYVSFESRKPVVYVHDVASGQRRLIANFRGSSSAPAWAPDGKTLAVTLTQDGHSQLYTISAQGGEPTRLTESDGIDTEPVFAPDASMIYFVSDRAGTPQIYRMPARGGAPERVTFSGSYNISPALSPDGRWLAYISRVDGLFRLHVMELATGAVRPLTATGADERPSFSPNGRLIVYATRAGERETLMTTTLDGRFKFPISGASGDIREPDWGPFIH